MTDNCIISRETLSNKEQNLKSRLYGNTPI